MSDLPKVPADLEHIRKQAKDLLRAVRQGDATAVARLARYLPTQGDRLRLSQVQWVLAQEHGYPSWPKLKEAFEQSQRALLSDSEYLEVVARLALGEGWEAPKRAKALRTASARPELARLSKGWAALFGDPTALAAAPDLPGPRRLTALCAAAASVKLGTDSEADALACAAWLIENGSDPNEGHFEGPGSEWRLTPLYYAVGVAHSPSMTRLLLDAGANPNDNESLYHSMDAPNLECMRLVAEAGAAWGGTNALQRLLDREDPERLRLALEMGADPNDVATGMPPLLQAIRRDRSLEVVRMLLDAGADARGVSRDGLTPYRLAARRGRVDLLRELEHRGVAEPLEGAEAVVAAAAAGHAAKAKEHLGATGASVADFPLDLQQALPDLAQVGRTEGVRALLELGWPVDVTGDWGASALNQCAFHGDVETGRILLDHGAQPSSKNGYGGDVWGSLFWASANLGRDARVGRYAEFAQLLLDRGTAVPERLGGSDEVRALIEDWLEQHPDWPRSRGG